MRTLACLLLLVFSFLAFSIGVSITAEADAPDKPKKEPFSIQKLFPEAVPYAKKTKLKVKTGIVEWVQFDDTRAKVRLHNNTEQRIKPDATIWLLNADGVILETIRISWLIDSLEPEKSHDESETYRCGMPEALMFSRLADSWDDRPAWVLVAGSKYRCDKLKKRAADRLKALRGGKAKKSK